MADSEYVAVDEAFTTDENGMRQDAELDEEESEQIGHMQEVIPKLWIGDIYAATDVEALKEAGIVSWLLGFACGLD